LNRLARNHITTCKTHFVNISFKKIEYYRVILSQLSNIKPFPSNIIRYKHFDFLLKPNILLISIVYSRLIKSSVYLSEYLILIYSNIHPMFGWLRLEHLSNHPIKKHLLAKTDVELFHKTSIKWTNASMFVMRKIFSQFQTRATSGNYCDINEWIKRRTIENGKKRSSLCCSYNIITFL
jgi:hypothetical protein